MPTSPHIEGYLTANEMARDNAIGEADELTVPIALARLIG